MLNKSVQERMIRLLTLTGILAVIFYVAHVIAGRMIWEDYNPLTQPISDLTADTAVSQEVASQILIGYNVCILFFCLFLVVYFKKKQYINRYFYVGIILKFIVELLSVIGYKLFPLSDTTWENNFQNVMHYVITGVIVVGYITLSILLTIGLKKTRKYPVMTRFMIIFCIVFIGSGLLTVIAANEFPQVVGLIERINLYSLMSSNVALSQWVYNMERK